MFWSTHTSESKVRKPSITVEYHKDEDRPIINDLAGYPFLAVFNMGNTCCHVWMTKDEADTLAFQLNAQLQESDRANLKEL